MRNAGARDAGPRVKKNWVAPGDGWIKINVDGAFSSTAGDGGIGVVVRDSHDTALLSSWRYIPRAKEAEEMEAMAAREGLILAAERFHHRAMLETDCSTVAIALRHRDDRRSNLKFILEEAIEAGARLPEWTAVHTRRECNSAAHELAQLARRTKHSSVWQSAMPVCIEQIIARDCNQLPE
ncbi:unnamed protein product [Urochloa decumbens]|uniref:RNase H type-1 domain-containing protein n=1 Tax=Urochloa decumbens TaxID=240449 RepID=A0ABC9FL41_9POAL